jgi:hypothetical protein
MSGLGYKQFVDGTVAPASEANGYLMQQAVMVFASAAARDTALSGVIANGMMAYTTDNDMLWVRKGGAWWEVLPWSVRTTSDIPTPINAAWGNVTGFSFPMVAGTYAVEAALFLLPGTGASSLVDVRLGWSWTGTAAVTAGMTGNDVNLAAPGYTGPNTGHAVINQTSSPLDETTGLGAVAGVPLIARASATVVCTVAGTMQLRLRQDTTNASALVNISHGSRLEARRIA